MHHVRLFTLGALISALSVLPFVSCSLDSTESIPSENSRLTPYEASGFDDLTRLGDMTVLTDGAIDGLDMDDYHLETDIENALDISMNTGLLGILDELIPTRRSIGAELSMQVRDDMIAWEDDPFEYIADIDHLDLKLEGNVSSLGTLLERIPEDHLPESITAGLSVQLSSKIHTMNVAEFTLANEFSESIYVSLAIEHDETIGSKDTDPIEVPISGPIGIDFKYSLASLFSPLPGVSNPGVIPSVFEMELKPIRNLTLQPIVNALIAAEFQGPSVPDPDDAGYEEDLAEYIASIEELFEIVKPLIWGNSTEPGLRITRKVMKNNGDIVVLKEATDAEAFIALMLAMNRFN